MTYELLPHQIPPEDNFKEWVMRSGRGTGKTFAAAHYVNKYAMEHPLSRIAIIAPDMWMAHDICLGKSSGLRHFNEDITVRGHIVLWRNGTEAYLLTATSERLYLPTKVELAWCEEVQLWNNEEKYQRVLKLCKQVVTTRS